VNFAGSCSLDADDGAHQGRLPAAAGAEKPGDAAGGELEVQSFEDSAPSPDDREAADGHGGARAGHPVRVPPPQAWRPPGYTRGVNARLAVALVVGKAAGLLVRRLGRGGTALPGLVATRLDPDFVATLGRQLPRRVLVTGTNGKTTTCRMLAAIFEASGITALHNREGSNMVRGFASTLIDHTGARGRLAPHDLGLFETDEATMPAAVAALDPGVIAFTNLFRDQLDRYGEVDTVAAIWRESLGAANAGCTLVLNADDPLVAALGRWWPGPVHYFGVDSPELAAGEPGPADARWCPACGSPLVYEARYVAHVGHWRCDACGERRPVPATIAREVVTGLEGSRFRVDGMGDTVSVAVAGAYNVYNAVAAVAVARVLGIGDEAIGAGLAAVRPAFGRQEVIEYRGRRLRLLLCKNPAGANQVLAFLASVAHGPRSLAVAVLLNDRFADGRDVSWTWDVVYEQIAPVVDRCWAGGERAEDMALRLKYAGWPAVTAVERIPGALLDAVVAGTGEGEDVFILPTYTAMLDLRAELVRRGATSPYWGRRR